MYKKVNMLHLKKEQIQYEMDTWKRLLVFMQEENVYLKNRLSDILKDRFDHSLLEEIDEFQNRFVKADQLITLLRHEIAEIETDLNYSVLEAEKIKNEIKFKNFQLQKNLIIAEKNFSALKLTFNNYISIHT